MMASRILLTANFQANVSVRLGGCNLPPTITAATGLSRQQGSPAYQFTNRHRHRRWRQRQRHGHRHLGQSLKRRHHLQHQNTGGNVTANIVADCTASNASFTLQASDGSFNLDRDLERHGHRQHRADIELYQSAGTRLQRLDDGYAGDGERQRDNQLPGAGRARADHRADRQFERRVSITNAQPAGTHTITIRATDDCGAVTDASFTLPSTRAIKQSRSTRMRRRMRPTTQFTVAATLIPACRLRTAVPERAQIMARLSR